MLCYWKGKSSKKGDYSDKKKIQLTYFFMRNPYMKFQKTITLNGQKLQRAITPTTFHLIGWKFNQVISLVAISIPNIKALAQTLSEISC